MNFKKNWKRFWTLSSAREGFTLVELIVVIAILAILAGVAVPAYSGYVKKANMQADITLISEIEHALTLAGYNGTFADGEGGYITLSATTPFTSEQAGEGSALDEALKATFGENYSLQLKYDGWGNNGLIDGLSPMMAGVVANSNYLTGGRVEYLLSDVEKMTNMAQNLVTSLSASSGIQNTTLSSLFTADVLNETAVKYGIGDESWTAAEWDEWGSKQENATAYGNLLVLAAADESEKFVNGEIGLENMSIASQMILEFSSYYAFAATNPDFSAELDVYMDQLNDGTTVTDASTGAAWYSNLKAAADKYNFDAYCNTAVDDNGNTAADLDKFAFLTIMAGLGAPTQEQADIIASDLGNANLFTDGVVNNMYNDYMDAVDTLAGLYGGTSADADVLPLQLNNGEIAILFNLSNGGIETMNTLPSA